MVRWRRRGRRKLIRLVCRICPKKLDLGARLFQIAERRLGRSGISIDRKIEVEPVVEGLAEHRPAIQPGKVHAAPGETVEGVGQAARAMRGDKGERAFPS